MGHFLILFGRFSKVSYFVFSVLRHFSAITPPYIRLKIKSPKTPREKVTLAENDFWQIQKRPQKSHFYDLAPSVMVNMLFLISLLKDGIFPSKTRF